MLNVHLHPKIIHAQNIRNRVWLIHATIKPGEEPDDEPDDNGGGTSGGGTDPDDGGLGE